MIRLRNVLMISWVLIANQVLAQKYSVQEAIDFAVSHQITVKNSELDVSSAEAKIKEILSTGLPQIISNLMYILK